MRSRPCSRVERAVIADLIGAAVRRPSVEAVPAVAVVRLPGRVRRLEQELRGAAVIAHYEGNVACAGHAVLANEFCDIDPGCGVCRNRPASRLRPIATVYESG